MVLAFPSLADARQRIDRAWLLDWLDDPVKVRPGANMPALFAADRTGFVERWLIADHLVGPKTDARPASPAPGDHRMGRRLFISVGCAACHLLPDLNHDGQTQLGRTPLDAMALGQAPFPQPAPAPNGTEASGANGLVRWPVTSGTAGEPGASAA